MAKPPSSGPRHKRRPPREEARRILIVTEGTTSEPEYLDGLSQYLRSRHAIPIVKTVGVGKDPLAVVEKCCDIRDQASKQGKEYDYCVCLVDVDQHATLQDALKIAQKEGIILLISRLKFEVWLRWHIEDSHSQLNSKQLDQRCGELKLISGKRLSRDFPYSGFKRAYQTAHRVDPGLEAGRIGPDPSTALPVLIDLLTRHPGL